MQSKKSEHPVCPIPSCMQKRAKVRFRAKSGRPVESALGVETTEVLIYECPECGLRFTPEPAESVLEEYYKANYHHQLARGHATESRIAAAKKEAQKRIEHFNRFCPQGRVLDVGCSTGLFASSLRKCGYDVSGLDVSEEACAEARKFLGDNVYCGRIEDNKIIPECGFEAVTLLDVIEHFADPVEPLKAIHRCLKPGGVLLMRTPTLRSLFFRVADWSYDLTRGRFVFPILKIYHAEHLLYFNESIVIRLLEDTGFEVLDMKSDPLHWKNFRAAELNYGFILNGALAVLYFLGRWLGRGHGVMVVARKAS